jgi:hypothetical protein
MLQMFCRGLVSALPNTATIESEFSDWMGKERLQMIFFFSLEEILHSIQFKHLKTLSSDISTVNSRAKHT